MITWEFFLSILGAGLTIGGIAAIVFANARNGATKQIIDNQNSIINTLKEKIDLYEAERVVDRATLKILRTEIAAVKLIPLEQIAADLKTIAQTQSQLTEIYKMLAQNSGVTINTGNADIKAKN